MKKLISKDEASGKETFMEINRDGEKSIIQNQHVDPIIDSNKKRMNDWKYGNLIGNTQKHHQEVATIPNLLYMQLREKFGHPQDNPKDWAKWLNDPENRYFRTGGGRI